jgi:hypothetical protein
VPPTLPLTDDERITLEEALQFTEASQKEDLTAKLSALYALADVDARLRRLRSHLVAYDDLGYDADNIVPLAANDGLDSRATRSRSHVVDRIRIALGYPPLLLEDADDPDALTTFTLRFGGG